MTGWIEPKRAELPIKNVSPELSCPSGGAISGSPEFKTEAAAKAEAELDKIGPPNDFSAFWTALSAEFCPKNKLAVSITATNKIGKMAYEILSEIVLMVNILLLTGKPVNPVRSFTRKIL